MASSSGTSSPTGAVVAELLRERQLAAIDSEEFAEWWAGGRKALQQRRALEQLFFDDAEFDDPKHITYMSHKELFEYATAKSAKFLTKLRAWYAQQQQQQKGSEGSTIESMYEFRMLLSGTLGTGLFQQSFPLRLHYSMFLPALLGQSTEEQQRVWLEKAWRMDGIIGTYAQTELGHGTYLRGLETRADYDVEREEFILNTPTLTAYKWWPGGLGHSANMVVVMAQLYIEDKHCGMQPFLVRIRNEQTHMPEPGVDVGEIGPKVGINAVNNGFLGFRNVRIPRNQMLMKHAQVKPDGTFVKSAEPLLTYGTMVYVRVLIIRDVSLNLLQAATIATRYSAVRRQSPIEPGEPEPQIIDHVTQQAKVFPQIAKGLFFRLVADIVWGKYKSVVQELNAGDRRNLAELHALSCCLKSVCSSEAAAGVEVLRKACGGNGYLTSSNFSQIYGLTTAACTYEGENTVMLLQTARFLVKNYVDGLKRKVLPKSVTYLRVQARLKWSKKDLLATLVQALEITAAETTRLAFEHQNSKRKLTKSEHKAANMSGLQLTQAATMHGRAYLARVSCEEVARLQRQVSPVLAKVLAQLLDLFVLELFMSSLGDVLRFNAISARQLADVEQRYEQALAAFRGNAVSVVDGFDFHDRVLDSTLGCYDGRVYERLMAAAKSSPLNQEPVNATFHTHLQPCMRGKL